MNDNQQTLTRDILKKVRFIEIKTRGVVNEMFSGEYHSAFKGRGIDFAEVREYSFGDDVRLIDWNVSARLGHPYVKVFQEERELVLILMVDISSSGKFGSLRETKSEIAAEISAVLAFSALKNNDKVGLILFSDRIELFVPPKKGKSHVLRILRELLFFKPQGKGTDIAAALEYLNKVTKKKAIVFLVSDFWDAEYDAGLKIAGAKHDLIALRITDPRERRLPPAGLLKVRDLETGRRLVLDLHSPAFRDAYRDTVNRDFADLLNKLNRCSVDYIEVDASGDYINSLVLFFKRRGTKR